MKTELLIIFGVIFVIVAIPAFAEYEIISPDDFELDISGSGGIFSKNIIASGILESGKQYFAIQKVEHRLQDFPNNNTNVNATVGYAFQLGDQMLQPPMGKSDTDPIHQEFMNKVQEQQKEFPKQSSIGQSYNFVVDIDNPFYIKFPFVINQAGQYTYLFYHTTDMFQGPGSGGMGGFVVVEKYSRALDEDGICKNEGLTRLIKHDYSTVACTSVETFFELKARGWGIN